MPITSVNGSERGQAEAVCVYGGRQETVLRWSSPLLLGSVCCVYIRTYMPEIKNLRKQNKHDFFISVSFKKLWIFGQKVFRNLKLLLSPLTTFCSGRSSSKIIRSVMNCIVKNENNPPRAVNSGSKQLWSRRLKSHRQNSVIASFFP